MFGRLFFTASSVDEVRRRRPLEFVAASGCRRPPSGLLRPASASLAAARIQGLPISEGCNGFVLVSMSFCKRAMARDSGDGS